MSYKVKFYVSYRGEEVIKKFIVKLDKPTYSKYVHLIDSLAIYGPNISFPYSRRLTKCLSELRTTGKNPVRLIYTNINNIFVILHAFQKKTNKTPPQEIRTAESRKLTLI
ncbi:MAG: type II toxin-antitoxin system RelE/ParE family toxin [Candidatus Shapirobacteria bacterium]|jgi:phage-related protein